MADFNLKPSDILGGDNPIKKLGQFRLFINMLKDHFNKSYTGLAGWVIPSLVLVLIYVIMPFDFDFIPLVGWIDDAALVAIFYKFVGGEIKKYEDWRKNNIEAK